MAKESAFGQTGGVDESAKDADAPESVGPVVGEQEVASEALEGAALTAVQDAAPESRHGAQAGGGAGTTSGELTARGFGATLGVLFSRLSGIIRSQFVNAYFGASVSLDAFYVAARLPNNLRDLFAEGALSAAFTKEYVEESEKGAAEARRLVDMVVAFFSLVTLVLALLGVLFSSGIVHLFTEETFARGPGFALAVTNFRFLVFYLPMSMLSAVAMAILATQGRTFRAMIASTFFNVGTIFGAVFLRAGAARAGYPPVLGLTLGTLAGGLFQFLYLAHPLWRQGALGWPKVRLADLRDYKPLRGILLLMAPRLLGQGATTFALLINTNYATGAGEGALVYIQNATLITLVPIGLFGVATGMSSLPMLTAAVHKKDFGHFRRLLSEGLGSTLWLTVGSSAAFALLSFPLCFVLFRHGRYTAFDVSQTAVAICAYSGGMVFNSGIKVLTQGFYGLGDTRQTTFNALVYLALSATLSSLLAPRYGIVGLGVSNSVSAFADFTLNYFLLKRLLKKKELQSMARGPSELEEPTPLENAQETRSTFLPFPSWLGFSIASFACVTLGVVFQRWSWRFVSPALTGTFRDLLAAAGILGACGLTFGGFFLLVLFRCGPEPLQFQIARLLRKALARVPMLKRI